MLGIIKKFSWVVIILLIGLGIIFFWPKQKQNSSLEPEKMLKNLTIEPTEEHSATVIFLHGLGDSASNWENNFRPIAKNYPSVKFIIPEAPITSIGMNYGWPSRAWYNVRGSIRDIMNLKEDKAGLMNSVKQVQKIIQKEINFGIKPEKIIVGGFSQGGATALAVGLTSDYQLGGIICLSGFLPCRKEIFNWAKEKSKEVPFHFYHSYHDDLIPYNVGKKTTELLTENGYNVVKFTKLDDFGHIWPWREIKKMSDEELKKQGRKGEEVLRKIEYGKMHYRRGFSEKEWKELENLPLGNKETHTNFQQNNFQKNKDNNNSSSEGLGTIFLIGVIILIVFGIVFIYKKLVS